MARRPWERGGWPCRFSFVVVLRSAQGFLACENVLVRDHVCDRVVFSSVTASRFRLLLSSVTASFSRV